MVALKTGIGDAVQVAPRGRITGEGAGILVVLVGEFGIGAGGAVHARRGSRDWRLEVGAMADKTGWITE